MNGSGQRTIPNVVFLFRSMISKSFSVADNGSEYQVGHYVPPDISRREPAAPAGSRTSVLNVQVLEDEHKSPLLKWDRTFSLSGSIRDGWQSHLRHADTRGQVRHQRRPGTRPRSRREYEGVSPGVPDVVHGDESHETRRVRLGAAASPTKAHLGSARARTGFMGTGLSYHRCREGNDLRNGANIIGR